MAESWRVVLAAAMGGAIVSGLAACSSPSAALPAASAASGLMGTHGIVTFVSFLERSALGIERYRNPRAGC